MKRMQLWAGLVFGITAMAIFIFAPDFSHALNIMSYRDTISDSKPSAYANHTFEFTVQTDIAAGGYIDIQPPAGFSIIATSTFSERNVELFVDDVLRLATTSLSATHDQIVITTGSPGNIRYNLNTTDGISTGSRLRLRVGNHTTYSELGYTTYSTSTGTTTVPSDVPGIQNSSATTTHRFAVSLGGSAAPAYAGFVIQLVDPVTVGPIDTTEEIPPFRFNGAPSGEIGGTTLSVEISLETDEFSWCRYSTTASTSFTSMYQTFENSGLIVHSQEITALVNETTYNFYIRCIDDEGNFNTDDYVITFTVPEVPVGDPNGDGDNDGDGSGPNDTGGGGGTGAGNTGGNSGGSNNTGGGGSGGGGGGGGGGSGAEGGNNPPGGSGSGSYESGDATVIISGYAFPGSQVVALVDGNIAKNTRAGNDGRFSVTIDAIARGVYTFGVYATDRNSVKSSTFSTSFTVSGGRTSTLSNINVMPSIKVSPNPVDPGQTLSVSGYAIPNARITIENRSEKSSASLKTFFADSDSNGAWSATIDTTGFSRGTYQIRAKAEQTAGVSTNFSNWTFYGVGEKSTGINADLNRDGKVNLTDFSILLFWWGGNGGPSDPPADINRDGTVSLTDFSILLFNWTG